MAKREVQYRTSFDLRASDDDVAGFEGHAASWWSIDSHGTAFAPGAFKKTIRERRDRIPVLWNHDPSAPIGKHREIREDDHGLYVNIDIADDGAEGSVLVKRLRFGVPIGMSFGFITIKDRSAEPEDPLDFTNAPWWLGEGEEARKNVRVITETSYWESSPVTFPSNENSTIDAIRSARREQEADAIASLHEHIRAGTLTPEQTVLIADLVAAFQQRSEPKPEPPAATTPLDPEARHRNRLAELALIELGQLWSVPC